MISLLSSVIIQRRVVLAFFLGFSYSIESSSAMKSFRESSESSSSAFFFLPLAPFFPFLAFAYVVFGLAAALLFPPDSLSWSLIREIDLALNSSIYASFSFSSCLPLLISATSSSSMPAYLSSSSSLLSCSAVPLPFFPPVFLAVGSLCSLL